MIHLFIYQLCLTCVRIYLFLSFILFQNITIPVTQIINELKDGDKIVTIAVTLPVTFSLDKSLLDLWDQSFVPFHDSLQFGGLCFLFIWSSILHQSVKSLCQPSKIENVVSIKSIYFWKNLWCYILILVKRPRSEFTYFLVSALSRFLQRDWKLSFSLLNSAEV